MNKYYPRFGRRSRIFTVTSIIALFSLMVAPNNIGVTYAHTTSAQIQALLTQASHLKSTIQAQSTQISKLSAGLPVGPPRELPPGSLCTSSAPGSLCTVQVMGDNIPIQPDQIASATADCPAGSVVTGGGFTVTNNLVGGVRVSTQQIQGVVNGWEVIVVNLGTNPGNIEADAMCATIHP